MGANTALLTLSDAGPADDLLYAAVFPGLTIICAPELREAQPRFLRPGWLAEGTGRRVVLHSMNGGTHFLAFAVWRANGTLERSLCASPDQGVVEDHGDPLPFEPANRTGRRPLPTHLSELGRDALAALCAITVDHPPRDGMPDPHRVPLAGFRLGAPTVTLRPSHGPSITRPSPLDVEAHVIELGHRLEHLTLDMGDGRYLRATGGSRSDRPAGAFGIERHDGPDLHFRCCHLQTLEDVAGMFRDYLAHQYIWGGHGWEKLRV